MITPKVEPTIACMPGFRTWEDHYNAWEMLESIFAKYRLDKFREAFWDMCKSAMMDKENYHKKQEHRDVAALYEDINSLTTAVYILAEQKGLKIYKAIPATAFFPEWQSFKFDAWEALFKIFDTYKLDNIRAQLWTMFKSAMLNKFDYHTWRERYDLIFLFERLNDLVTAAYVITKEQYQSQNSNQRTDAATVTPATLS